MQKLSIITINYNNLEGLKRTVESVMNQTWREFEYIVIDGGSTDGSAAYIKSQDDKIDYWVSEPDKGIYNAMNKGILKATGEYLLFLNSGDHFFSNEVIKYNRQHVENFDLVYFNLKMVGENNSKVSCYPDTLRFSDLYFGSLPHSATFIKSTLFEKVGFYDEKLKIVSDWKFFILALFYYHCSYVKINETLSVFYLDGISSKNDNTIERTIVLNKYFKEYVLDYKILSQAQKNELILSTNRFKMLSEVEKSLIGRKIASIFFRIYLVLFSKKSLRSILGSS